ncbi:hypothetical protein D1007_10798 [Hordeum vulgare]|uniref:Predicted protein n=1 Tax=Hordeum vulgare subsp. vulgare TaxID=112509 RepID=F2EGY5_HORVV|nr:keratin-associated protein 17-1-like [Hordeum vulgare subsp. vulgare]KAE8812191.1 hypothetical protein D1007_10798 [Hordeum vulgare]BAK06607.1 predicted protein [Hordeum vulgare subsp. vulgare]
MEGRKKERVMAGAVCVLVILLSAQRLPVGIADASSAFCQCYLGCFDPGCSGQDCQYCHGFCCDIACRFHGDGDFDSVCGGSGAGGQQASACGTEYTGRDLCDTVEKANYWSRRHIKAKAKHG